MTSWSILQQDSVAAELAVEKLPTIQFEASQAGPLYFASTRRRENVRATVADLENKVREIIEERDFYKGERDYFQNLAYSTIGAAKIPTSHAFSERVESTSSVGTTQRNGDARLV